MKKDGKSDELAAALKGTARSNAELEQATMRLAAQNDRLEKVLAGRLTPRTEAEFQAFREAKDGVARTSGLERQPSRWRS